jgi:hypothetical protein
VPSGHLPVFRHAGAEPFVDQSAYHAVSDSLVEHGTQPLMFDRIEVPLDVD